ncbi:MAG: hypothetical protein OEY79_04895 [Anaplasmataceae bacterium]|nr:hypothetical protein [Anaplasmataceae bacterium]
MKKNKPSYRYLKLQTIASGALNDVLSSLGFRRLMLLTELIVYPDCRLIKISLKLNTNDPNKVISMFASYKNRIIRFIIINLKLRRAPEIRFNIINGINKNESDFNTVLEQ